MHGKEIRAFKAMNFIPEKRDLPHMAWKGIIFNSIISNVGLLSQGHNCMATEVHRMCSKGVEFNIS